MKNIILSILLLVAVACSEEQITPTVPMEKGSDQTLPPPANVCPYYNALKQELQSTEAMIKALRRQNRNTAGLEEKATKIRFAILSCRYGL